MKRYHLYSILLGFLKIVAVSAQNQMQAVPAFDFLHSIGACVHVQHGQDASRIAPLLKYTGIRNVRDAADRNYDMTGLLLLHREAGVKVVIGPGSGAREPDVEATITMAKTLHQAGALLAIEGPNEPNNFGGLHYEGVAGGRELSWLPVARFQRDLYARVKGDSQLKRYPVYSVSETGAQTDDCGLQFLEIPQGSGTLMPDGTKYADYANVHNYMYHPGWPGAPHDNQVWNAADPTSSCRADGLYGNYGKTWLKGYRGYTEEAIEALPRVTTETGVRVGDCGGAITEEVQACNYLNLFLAQYKRGWSRTFIYEFIDDPDGAFGFYGADYTTKRKAADYLHNLTTLLNDQKSRKRCGKIAFTTIDPLPETVHNLLLQKSDGCFWLVLWGEKVSGEDKIRLCLPTSVKQVVVYDPTRGTAPQQTLRNEKARPIPLTLSNHPLLLELKR